ncbi:autotransporter outer membrane beta-barrel domain-containing protein [Yersinia aleksiciae]|uniref:autotransporter outer membrane beta-barrel domain-containing protein n=3 Tax=Yersinia aleksiciae TaxID=263819 RepID=UPI002E0E45E3|nr:autotransporter outer membrane beta-barrel domain-containing protein [Yersinia aleksiciae]
MPAAFTTAAELADKTREFNEATDAVVNLSKVTDPTIDMPAFEQTIAKTEKQTVAADTVAFSTQVAGGTQEVADKGKIIGSIVTNDGSIVLAVGAQAIDTQITEGTMSNNGGTDKHINFYAMYVSPYIALNTFASGKSQYPLSNGMDAQNQGSRNTTGTLGMNTGYRFILNSGAEIKPYAIFSVDRDLKASNNVTINKETFDNSRKGTRVNAGAGINVNLTKNLSVGSEVKLSKGKNISTPVTINLGVGYTF